MKDENQNERSRFTFEKKGLEEVSTQIMDSYNSGFMGEQEAKARTQENLQSKGE
ncbi:hypothetical protein [Bacillus sp. FJAT-18017]|uniref:hypothetical protein n=1 Tax=Bacillus sp. FJAT-18017 TaxID=1705566 RepID=UPI000A6FED5A|nr:hypothetical protein [Bacillus sp. FJAT-18017]